MNFSQACDKAIEYSFYLLFFLVPLMMTPYNYELFEFNKMLLVYFLTTIIVAAWLIKMVIHKKFIFRRTFLDLPLLIFFFSQLASTISSFNFHTSLWSYYSRFHGGLFSTISYLLLYWSFATHLDKEKTLSVIRYTLYSAVLVALYGIAEHFGIDAKYWVQDVRNRVFSSLGQPNWLAAYLVALLPIPMAMLLGDTQDEKRKTKKNALLITYYALLISFYLCLLYTKSRSGILGFVIAYALFWLLIFLRARTQKAAYARNCVKPFLIFTFSILLFTFLVGTPWTPNLGQIRKPTAPPPTTEPAPPIPRGGTESGEIRKIVWKGAIEVWKHWPIFGSGVETFAYSYYNFRPREHNDVSEWDFLYNRAHNEYLNFAATTGTVGLLAYLAVIVTFIRWVLRRVLSEQNVTNGLIIALFAGYTSILVTNFFGFSVVAVALFFFLFPAMAVVLIEPKGKKMKETGVLKRDQYLTITLILLFTSYILITLVRFWYADTFFAKGEKFNQAKQYDTALSHLQQAIILRSNEPFYYDELSLSSANLAILSFQQNEATFSAELIESAINASDQTLEFNPYHVNFWKNRARLFYILAEIDESYNQQALDALLEAAELAPTDAKVFYNLGLMYAQIGEEETAIQTLEKTVELRPSYRNARYALALFYEEKGDLKAAREQLEYILEKINPDDEAIREKLEGL